MREKISLMDSVPEMMMKLSEGNPGAISALMKAMEKSKEPLLGLHLDDMNIRGCQIWVAYKDFCGEDIDKFIKCVKDRDQEMVACVNAKSGSDELAVSSGASFTR